MDSHSRRPAHTSGTNLSRIRSPDGRDSWDRLRPIISRGDTCSPRIESCHFSYGNSEAKSPIHSNQSLNSLSSSDEDLVHHDREVTAQYPHEGRWSHDAMPATSRDFSELFPSARRLEIRHDDTTIDGNMNLRIDTPVRLPRGERRRITLFHLRMQDLRQREFSLRRYSRDSGHHVCTSSRKPRDIRRRPSLSRSLSNALSSFKSRSEMKSGIDLQRHDSGYDSIDDDDNRKQGPVKKEHPRATDSIGLEFSNYAHLDIKRKGLKVDKHYDFEYWGARYSWKSVTKKAFGITRVSFHLLRRNDQQIVAHIVPEQLTDKEAKEELEAGGWVPPCSMWISDSNIIESLADISDVVVATGIMALVDDSIRRHFHEKETRQLVIPIPLMAPLQVNLDNLGPKHLIDEAFGKGKPMQQQHQAT